MMSRMRRGNCSLGKRPIEGRPGVWYESSNLVTTGSWFKTIYGVGTTANKNKQYVPPYYSSPSPFLREFTHEWSFWALGGKLNEAYSTDSLPYAARLYVLEFFCDQARVILVYYQSWYS